MQKISNKIEQIWEEYKEFRRSNPSIEEIKNYEEEVLWPLTVSSLEKSAEKILKRHDKIALITTVGYSPEPIAGAIIALKPEYICFVHTDESERTITTITKLSALNPDKYKKFHVSSKDDIYTLYEKIRQTINYLINNKGFEEKEIFIDVTGGTKLMAFAAGLVGQNMDLNLIYVSNHKYDVNLRKPVNGTEYISYQPSLTKSFPDGTYLKVLSLMENLDFTAAKKLLEEIGSDNKTHTLTGKILEILIEWEHYRYDEALKKLSETKTFLLKKYKSPQQLLKLISKWEDHLTLITKNEPYYKSLDVFLKTTRHLEKGDVVYAVIMSYTALELVIETFFERLGVKRDKFQPETFLQNKKIQEIINKNKLEISAQKILKKLFGKTQTQQHEQKEKTQKQKITYALGLTESVKLLSLLFPDKISESDCGSTINHSELRNDIVHRLKFKKDPKRPPKRQAEEAMKFFLKLSRYVVELDSEITKEAEIFQKYKKIDKFDPLKNEEIIFLTTWLKLENLSEPIEKYLIP